MKYVKKEETKNVEKKEKFDLPECLTVWKQSSKGGKLFLSGFTQDKLRVIGFINETATEENKQPNIRIYAVNEDGSIGDQLVALWKTISNSKREYLTGSTNENEKLIGFYGDEHNEKIPYIKVYYKKD